VPELEQSLLASAAEALGDEDDVGAARPGVCEGDGDGDTGAAVRAPHRATAPGGGEREGAGNESGSTIRIAREEEEEEEETWLAVGWWGREWVPQACAAMVLTWPLVLPSITATPLLAGSLLLKCLRISPQTPRNGRNGGGVPGASSLACGSIVGMPCGLLVLYTRQTRLVDF